MRCRTTTTARRAGMTLIELLVVMAIIGVLASLTIGAVFTVRESQMKSFTETTLQKLQSALDQQYKAVLEQVAEESVPVWAMAMARTPAAPAGDARLARVIYTKARLNQEFPATFAVALNPGGAIAPISVFPAKATYAKNCTGVAPDPTWESSALLYLALSQGRRGQAASSNLDDAIEPSALQTRAATTGQQFQVLIDSYGNPLRFYLYPTGNDELNSAIYVKNEPTYSAPIIRSSPGSGRDPVDPEGTLYNANWPVVLRNQYTSTFHALNPTAINTANYPDYQPSPPTPFTAADNPFLFPKARYLIPVIASAGRDGKWGIVPRTMARNPNGPPPATEPPDGWGYYSDDNIYSYRLRRSGARGD